MRAHPTASGPKRRSILDVTRFSRRLFGAMHRTLRFRFVRPNWMRRQNTTAFGAAVSHLLAFQEHKQKRPRKLGLSAKAGWLASRSSGRQRQPAVALRPMAGSLRLNRERRLVRKRGFEPPRPCGHKLLRQSNHLGRPAPTASSRGRLSRVAADQCRS